MTRRNVGWMGLVAVMLGAVACTPSPEKVCNKMGELDKDMAGNAVAMAGCKAMLEAVKAKDGDAYKCFAKCVVGASDKATAEKCNETCPAMKKALGM